MDSYSFHFERMSNVDLHPLSLPISRLSPAKSNSSIVEQLAHHQHGKGDSAYSSFSGGSTAPDYPSSFLPEDLQSSSFSHYADLKYVKSICHPSPVLQSDSKTMDQLYRSVEAISQQYCSSTKIKHHNANDSSPTNNKVLFKQEVPLGNPSPSAYARVHPPPVPARLDSFIATKNLENSNMHHHGTEFQTQHPQPQLQPRPYSRPHQAPHGINLPRADTPNPDPADSNSSDPVCSVWRGSQQQQAQGQQPPVYRPHLQPHDQTRVPLTQEHLFITDNKAAPEPQMPTCVLSRSPPRGASQPEHVKLRPPSASNGDHHSKFSGGGNRFESQRKRAHSAHDGLGSEQTQTSSPWNAGFINSSIQHKGQFYFVTGMCKLSESGVRAHSASVCGSEAGSDSSNVLEKYQRREKQRSHSTMDNLFPPFQGSSIPDERETFMSLPLEKNLPPWSQDQENHRPSLVSARSSRSFDTLEDVDMMQSRDIGRHTASNPIFYCGPDRNSPPQQAASPISKEQPSQHNVEEQAKRGKRQPLGNVASERINKETTPLLYHLTGANRAALQLKNYHDFGLSGKETVLNKTSNRDVAINGDEGPSQDDASRKDGGEVASVACNTLDDSFKKYYKEKLKDAQSKVLRETSFKRRDLQLSWPHRVRQKLDPRPPVIHSFSSSQDSETSTDTLTPSVNSEDTERGSIKEEAVDNQKKTGRDAGKENGKPANVAQPQVARIGGRKRLTAEQKKMCYSEPEKLHQLGGVPSHSACRSFGNESDNLFAAGCQEEEEQEQHREQGLVAARRRMFETRGRALSASSALKTNLKNLQHKALVDYMERKTGQKPAEPPQPASQLPAPSRQRHSLGEKPFDWASRPPSANQEGKNAKKGTRPHSAGRILDSSSSSIRYAQYFSAQSCSGQYAGQPRWRESQGPAQVKSASVESLLDQPEPPSFFRNRSTSTPHTLQPDDCETDPPPADTVETWSPQKNAAEDQLSKPEAEGRQLVRVVAQRGKSMEELGASKIKKPSGLSKSSEQLDQLWRSSTGPAGPDRHVPFIVEARGAKGQERGRRKQPQVGNGLETVLQGPNQNPNKSLLKQNSEPQENPSRPTSPAQGRARSESPGPQGPVPDEFRSSDTSSNPPSPRGPEIKSTSSTPTQTKPPFDNRPCSRTRTSEREQLVDEPVDDAPPLEVSLSCGVTTDPSLWILPPEEELKQDVHTSPLTDHATDVSDQKSPSSASRTSASPRAAASDADVSQQREEESPEIEEEELGETPEAKETRAPEGRAKNLERPADSRQWEELVEEVVRADQSLASVLYPLANRKTALMLMEQLLSEDTLLMEEHYKKKQEQRGAAESDEARRVEGTRPCPDSLKPQCTEVLSKTELTEKKRLLVSCAERRLRSLEETQASLQTELRENAARGEALQALVRERCLPVEQERYGLFIGDLERVVSLLLCLSARLARVQNALSTVGQHTDAEEKQSLDSRHRLLCKQREDAKDLKDNLDRRESLVSSFLSRQLSAEQLQDYRRFVQTKASLLIRQKDLEEKQRLVEEQREALSYSLSV